jgi:hypothetical protein
MTMRSNWPVEVPDEVTVGELLGCAAFMLVIIVLFWPIMLSTLIYRAVQRARAKRPAAKVLPRNGRES